MINLQKVLKSVDTYVKSDKGKLKILDAKTNNSNLKVASRQERWYYLSIAEEFKEILYKYIKSVLPHFKKGTIDVGRVIKVHKEKGVKVEISFNPNDLRRKSLYPQGYPDGLNDIIALFSTGFECGYRTNRRGERVRKYAYGIDSQGKFTRGRTHLPPNDFLLRAVEEFNTKYQGIIKARLAGSYERFSKII